MKKCILIVEDDPAISRLIESNLLVAGYEPVCAMDGKQALDAISSHHFDLALCDIMLPELDGFELLPYMQERNIPVIYVSAKADVQSRVQGLRLGAEDYLVKPFDILELLVRMEKVLTREKLLRQVWGDEYIGETRTVDVHVAALRKKLGLTEQLATVFKLGYRLEVEA